MNTDERPVHGQVPMTGDNVRCVIMFVDIVQSTRLFEQLGDRAGQRVIARCLGILSDIAREEGGVVVKMIGDGMMARFDAADSAVSSACLMQKTMEENAHALPVAMAIRIGMHYGGALVVQGDVFGDVVNVAARMVAVARPGQIMATQEAVGRLSAGLCRQVRKFDRARVKGKRDPITMYEVVWEDENLVTHMVESEERPIVQTHVRLRLRFRGEEVVLDEAPTPFVIGRGEKCGLTVRTGFASRVHARIEYRRGKFVLIDESTNGTCVRTQDGKEVYLRREELPLWGAGAISLGRSACKESGDLIEFACL